MIIRLQGNNITYILQIFIKKMFIYQASFSYLFLSKIKS